MFDAHVASHVYVTSLCLQNKSVFNLMFAAYSGDVSALRRYITGKPHYCLSCITDGLQSVYTRPGRWKTCSVLAK